MTSYLATWAKEAEEEEAEEEEEEEEEDESRQAGKHTRRADKLAGRPRLRTVTEQAGRQTDESYNR